MELFFNECSLHGQFLDIQNFESSLDSLMEIRRVAKKYNRELYCHRETIQAMVTHQLNLPQIIGSINRSKANALMGWLGRSGPFWEDARRHPADEYLECQGHVVTDTAIGECAYLRFSSKEAQMASIFPSNWNNTPLEVTWHRNTQPLQSENLINHFTADTLEAELQKAAPPLQSWDQLARSCRQQLDALHFSEDAFSPLKGSPFVLAAAKSIFDLLSMLNKFKKTHNPDDGRNQDGDEIYQTYFTGPRAWFSDSSDREKTDFKHEMSFTHPERREETIFAPFHGKVQTPQMRIHFSWPVTARSPLYILYIGDKITKY